MLIHILYIFYLFIQLLYLILLYEHGLIIETHSNLLSNVYVKNDKKIYLVIYQFQSFYVNNDK